MTIRPGVRQVLLVLTVLAGLAAFAWAQAPAKPPAAAPVTVAALERQMPVGHLGVPLGTVVRVTGEGIDNRNPRRKADEGKTLIRVDTVAGKKLAAPAVFEFLRAPASVKQPAPGDRFDYYVHEYGEFDGVVDPPKELGIEKLWLPHDGFHYRARLTVHASNGGRK